MASPFRLRAVLGVLLIQACTFNSSGLGGDGSPAADLVGPRPDGPGVDGRADRRPPDDGSDPPDAGPADGEDQALPDRAGPDADPPVDGTDGPTDVPSDLSLCTQWTPRHFDPCTIPTAGPDLVLTAGVFTYDTTTGTLRNPGGKPVDHVQDTFDNGGTPARIISTSRFELGQGAVLRVTGTLPLVIASFGDLMIVGVLDAGSHTADATVGAGADPATCGGSAGNPGAAGNSGTGGGGGGGFQGRGGRGGVGDNDHQPAPQGGVGGMAVSSAPTVIRAGCSGGRSGNNTDTGAGHVAGSAVGGRGGGAIQLSAFGRLEVAGLITAGGAGGSGGPLATAAGGGGGGSGGYIGIEAGLVRISGALAANGGGGGEGPPFASAGRAGDDGRSDAQPAPGGATLTVCAGDGAAGSADAALAGVDVSEADNCGGGGGGGGAGFIVVRSVDTQLSGGSSPPAMIAQL